MARTSKREDELIKNGWTKRFVAHEPRLSEAAELYRFMGYEVHLEPLPPVDSDSPEEESGKCRTCFQGVEGQYKTGCCPNTLSLSKRIFDHSKVRFTANPKLALRAQTMALRPFRFTKNGYQKFSNVRSRDFGNNPKIIYTRPHKGESEEEDLW